LRGRAEALRPQAAWVRPPALARALVGVLYLAVTLEPVLCALMSAQMVVWAVGLARVLAVALAVAALAVAVQVRPPTLTLALVLCPWVPLLPWAWHAVPRPIGGSEARGSVALGRTALPTPKCRA
jgi:hypothetical protein